MQPFEVLTLVCGWLSGTIAGVAGFGSALLLLPLLTFQLGARRAIPVLTVAQLLGNLSRAGFGYREIHWKPALIFCAGAIPGSLLGSRLFVAINPPTLTRIVGVILLAVVAFRHTSVGNWRIPSILLAPAGALIGTLSAIAGTVGPLGAVVFLSLQLPATDFIATEAVTAASMHLAKCLAYGRFTALTLADAARGLILGAALVLGSWTGRRLISKMPARLFSIIVETLLLISAATLILGIADNPGAPPWKN